LNERSRTDWVWHLVQLAGPSNWWWGRASGPGDICARAPGAIAIASSKAAAKNIRVTNPRGIRSKRNAAVRCAAKVTAILASVPFLCTLGKAIDLHSYLFIRRAPYQI
jgi:hypothetical protein